MKVVASRTPDATRSGAASAGAALGPAILIADASPVVRRVMAATMSTVLPGAKIIEAASGPEAYEVLKAGSAEIAFVDMDLPEINGAEAVARAREDGAQPFVTLMAQEITPGWERCSREAEAYEFLEKPVDEEEVRQIIASYMRMKEPCRVLVADDSKAFRQLIRKVLAGSRFGMGVDVVDNGELALGLLRQQPYDVIFLDYDMPGLDGLETACLVQEVCPSARVIMVSACHDAAIEKAARYFGAVDFLKKPFYPTEIDRALHFAFELPLPSLLESIGGYADEGRPAAAG
jgi:CheY-like chemotaxis protein